MKDYSNQDLSGQWFKGRNLKNANFENAILFETMFESADLQGANFHNANMSHCFLTGANLMNACLADARQIDSAYTNGAKNMVSISAYGMSCEMIYGVRHDHCVMVKALTFWGTLAEFEAHIASDKLEEWLVEYRDYYQMVVIPCLHGAAKLWGIE
jgi:hypothetical protein